jgi:hypothetical protein
MQRGNGRLRILIIILFHCIALFHSCASVALALALVARNATLLESTVPLGDIIIAVADSLRDQFRNAALKRRILPALG